MLSIALVYAKDASRPRAGMDLIRWTALGRALESLGCRVHLVTDRPAGVIRKDALLVRDAADVSWDDYGAVKVCYQHSIDLVPVHPMIIARMCRVVDEVGPARDDARRPEILRQQRRIAEVARYVAVNDAVNARRWRDAYGDGQEALIVPCGCPETIPSPGKSPFPAGPPIVLFAGSLTAPRFVPMLNRIAGRLREVAPAAEVHFVGRDRRHLYGPSTESLDPGLVHAHPAVDVEEAWSYILHADVGLALAPSDEAFECELAKIYYYLRGGLPVVTESTALNRFLIDETGHGGVARYGDIDDIVGTVAACLDAPRGRRTVMEHMVRGHGWRKRAGVYVDAIRRRSAVPVGSAPP